MHELRRGPPDPLDEYSTGYRTPAREMAPSFPSLSRRAGLWRYNRNKSWRAEAKVRTRSTNFILTSLKSPSPPPVQLAGPCQRCAAAFLRKKPANAEQCY